MQLIARNKSVVTGQENLRPLHIMRNYPVFFGCVDHLPGEDLYADMSWTICPQTGVIQLDKLVPPEILYQAQHMDGTGATWTEFYKNFAAYLKPKVGDQVIEIGGGNGKIAEEVVKIHSTVQWFIVEANPIHPGNDRIHLVKQYFDESTKIDNRYDTVIFSHLLEHTYNPSAFLKQTKALLKPEGKLIFAYPDLETWLSKKYTNAINFEHSMFLTDYFVDVLLRAEGFKIIEKHRYQEHSIYYTCEIDPNFVKRSLPEFENQFLKYKKIFDEYISHYQEIVVNFERQLKGFSGDAYLFGAHIFSQALIQFGLSENLFAGILDNSPIKTGKRLYGTNLKVFKPEQIGRAKEVAVVLNVGQHRNEIYRQLREINPNVTIFEGT